MVNAGIEVAYFPVLGKGAFHYLENALKLRRFLKANTFDVIHAHYSLCGWVAVLAGSKIPVVLSLMGDDARGSFVGESKKAFKSRLLIALTRTVQPFVKAIIYKSPNMERAIHRKKIAWLVPNGVRLNQFQLKEGGYRQELGLDPGKRYVLFLANPEDRNKNIALVRAALAILNRPDVELINIFDAPHDTVVKYLNSVDVFTLCSFSEGSPNVVKEAMACNCPLVATNVGDVAWVTGETPGCLVSSHDPADFATKLSAALEFSEKVGRTEGRRRLLDLGLDARTIAEKIRRIYEQVSGKVSGSGKPLRVIEHQNNN